MIAYVFEGEYSTGLAAAVYCSAADSSKFRLDYYE